MKTSRWLIALLFVLALGIPSAFAQIYVTSKTCAYDACDTVLDIQRLLSRKYSAFQLVDTPEQAELVLVINGRFIGQQVIGYDAEFYHHYAGTSVYTSPITDDTYYILGQLEAGGRIVKPGKFLYCYGQGKWWRQAADGLVSWLDTNYSTVKASVSAKVKTLSLAIVTDSCEYHACDAMKDLKNSFGADSVLQPVDTPDAATLVLRIQGMFIGQEVTKAESFWDLGFEVKDNMYYVLARIEPGKLSTAAKTVSIPCYGRGATKQAAIQGLANWLSNDAEKMKVR